MAGETAQVTQGIWGAAAAQFWQNRYLIATLLVALALLDILGPTSGRAMLEMAGPALWAILGIAVFSAMLRGEALWTLSPEIIGPFLWRVAILALPGLVAGFGVLMLSLHRIAPQAVAELTAATFGLVTAVSLSLAGTWLSATIAEGNAAGLDAALPRGRKAFGTTLWQLIIGAGLPVLIAVAVLLGGKALGQDIGPVITLDARPGVLMIAARIVFQAALAFAVVMVSVILSRAYLAAEDKTGTK